MNNRKIVSLGGYCGIIGSLLYIAIILSDQFFWPKVKTTQEFLTVIGSSKYSAFNMGMHFVFVLALFLMLIAFLGLYRLLSQEKPNLATTIGTLFGIIACAVMVEMNIVQGSVMVKMGKMFLSATDDTQRQTAIALYKGLRYIDFGLDLAFDVFFFTAWMLLGSAMLRNKNFGIIFGSIGIVLFAVTTILNLWSAPTPPPFDMGPIDSLWVLAVYIQMVRSSKTLNGTVKTES